MMQSFKLGSVDSWWTQVELIVRRLFAVEYEYKLFAFAKIEKKKTTFVGCWTTVEE